MARARRRHVDDASAGLARAHAEVDVFDVREVVGVEQADLAQQVHAHHHDAARDEVHVLEPVEGRSVRLVLSAQAPDVLAHEQIAARRPDPRLVAPHADTRPGDPDARVAFHHANELGYRALVEHRVVVQEKDVVRPAVEHPIERDVVALAVAEILLVADQRDLGKVGAHGVGGAVGRAIVDDDRLYALVILGTHGLQTPGSVLSAVPVEHDDGDARRHSVNLR